MPADLLPIQQALTDFRARDLRTAALKLLQSIGYDSQRTIRLADRTAAGLVQQFQLAPADFDPAKALTDRWQEVEFLFQLTNAEVRRHAAMELFQAEVKPGDKNSFYFFALRLAPGPTRRAELASITRQLNRAFDVPVVVLMQCEDCLTLAVISRRPRQRGAGGDVLEKVSLIKDISLKAPHRAHLHILADLHLAHSGADSFEALLRCWRTALNTQELNKKFYRELAGWYYYAIGTIRLPEKPAYTATDAENVKNFAVRLICRTIFCWFLKEKGLVSRRLLELYDLQDRPTDLLPEAQNADPAAHAAFLAQNTYYRAVLQNVFFHSLNRPLGAAARAPHYLHRDRLPVAFDYGLFDSIPYLNGGLFDKLLEDNASDRTSDQVLRVPNELFYGESLATGTGRSLRRTQGLNRILDGYKFTVDENTPLEEDVALDPELLGLVFENLLAETDPDEDAAKTARKASGSFYTPRKVIDYMVNESLLLYLRDYGQRYHAPGLPDAWLTGLVHQARLPAEATPAFCRAVVDAFDSIRILDPACGSGAFPMGMLNRIVKLLHEVDPANDLWIDKQVAHMAPEVQDQTRRDLHRHDLDYARKLGLIRNGIYGVDIQPLAATITKLRFFISLLIEQKIDLGDVAHNYGISALPNLETKIICANTLLDVAPSVFDAGLVRNVAATRLRYYDRNRTAAEKEAYATELAGYLDALYPYEVFGKAFYKTHAADAPTRQATNRALLKEWFQHASLPAPFFRTEVFFPEIHDSERQGFDIVIGNPPYGGTDIPDALKTTLALASKDPYGAFMARFMGDGGAPTPLRNGGVLAYIVSDTFLTIKSHLPLRRQLLRHTLHKLVRVHPDTFSATVNTAIVLAQKASLAPDASGQLRPSPPPAGHELLVADLTNVSIYDDYDRFLELLTATAAPAARQAATAEHARYHYPQSLIATNANLPFFVASPKLFALMNDSGPGLTKKMVKVGKEEVQARVITLNGQEIPLVKLGQIAEVRQGLATGDNDAYLFQNPEARGNYRSIAEYADFLLTEDDLQRIRTDEKLRMDVIEQGIAVKNKKSSRYFEGRYIIPHDKGGESDVDSGWLPNYFVKTNYYIDWSETAVEKLKSYTIADRIRDNKEAKEIKPHYERTTAGILRNTETYFLRGIDYSQTGVYSPTFRINSATNYNTEATTIFATAEPYAMLAVLCSKLSKFFVKNFIDHTVHASADKLKEITFLLHYPAADLKKLVAAIIKKQKANPRYDYASHEQLEIDRLVYEAYGLNAADIAEVEAWYARRYPRLAAAQAANRAPAATA